MNTCANHEMEVREQVQYRHTHTHTSHCHEHTQHANTNTQMKQAADENCDLASGRQVWKCESSKSVTTVAEYATYQQKMLQKEREVRKAHTHTHTRTH